MTEVREFIVECIRKKRASTNPAARQSTFLQLCITISTSSAKQTATDFGRNECFFYAILCRMSRMLNTQNEKSVQNEIPVLRFVPPQKKALIPWNFMFFMHY